MKKKKKMTIIVFLVLGIAVLGIVIYLKKGGALGALGGAPSEETLAKASWIEYSTPRWRAAGLDPTSIIAEEWPRDKEDIIRRYRAGDFGSYL